MVGTAVAAASVVWNVAAFQVPAAVLNAAVGVPADFIANGLSVTTPWRSDCQPHSTVPRYVLAIGPLVTSAATSNVISKLWPAVSMMRPGPSSILAGIAGWNVRSGLRICGPRWLPPGLGPPRSGTAGFAPAAAPAGLDCCSVVDASARSKPVP